MKKYTSVSNDCIKSKFYASYNSMESCVGKGDRRRQLSSLCTIETNQANRIVSVHRKPHRTGEQWIKSHLCSMWSINCFLKLLHFNSAEIFHVGHETFLVSPVFQSQVHFCLTPKLPDSYRLFQIVHVFSEITPNFGSILSKMSLSYQLRGSAWNCH